MVKKSKFSKKTLCTYAVILTIKIAIANSSLPKNENCAKQSPLEHILGHIGRFWKNRLFFDFGGQNHLKNGKKIEIFKKNTMYLCGDFGHQNSNFEFFNAEK